MDLYLKETNIKTTEDANVQGKHLVNKYIPFPYTFGALFNKCAYVPWLLTKLIGCEVCLQIDVNC
jgi:hypothetical protein